ncbi:MAG TPA: hypothetical protein VFV33_27295, partial [Gemmatimonadaceae bacterium]|nr:hypothetical protein [Gemmatimonadaceae bacterium]
MSQSRHNQLFTPARAGPSDVATVRSPDDDARGGSSVLPPSAPGLLTPVGDDPPFHRRLPNIPQVRVLIPLFRATSDCRAVWPDAPATVSSPLDRERPDGTAAAVGGGFLTPPGGRGMTSPPSNATPLATDTPRWQATEGRGAGVHHLRASCRACSQPTLRRVLQLGNQPLANAFLRSPADAATESRFPLDLYFCTTCSLVQLADVIDPEVLFAEYIYVTGTSSTIAVHNREYARTVRDRLALRGDDLVVEIASNDGSLLGC